VSKKLKVAHVTPHVGGGVGTVLRDFFAQSQSSDLEHHLFCLDHCVSNFHELKHVATKEDGVYFKDYEFRDFIESLQVYDSLLVHYWNHPLLSSFLIRFSQHYRGFLVWTHNSGLAEPNIIPRYLVDSAKTIVFTSKCSFDSPNLKELIRLQQGKFDSIQSTVDLTQYSRIAAKRQELVRKPTRLLYVGTVSYAKLHSDAAKIFSELSKREFTVELVGGPEHLSLKAEIESLGGRCICRGHVEDVSNYYLNADIFVYPLRPDHYGTGEQVILEALASGLPVVAFNNPAEFVILRNGQSGFLVDSNEDFIEKVCLLARSRILFEGISIYNSDNTMKMFNSTVMSTSLNQLLSDSASEFKRITKTNLQDCIFSLSMFECMLIHSLFVRDLYVRDSATMSLADLFNESLIYIHGLAGAHKLNSAWLSSSKGSPAHYACFFPSDKYIAMFSQEVQKVASR
jgi:L-malate glycosyltransferase